MKVTQKRNLKRLRKKFIRLRIHIIILIFLTCELGNGATSSTIKRDWVESTVSLRPAEARERFTQRNPMFIIKNKTPQSLWACLNYKIKKKREERKEGRERGKEGGKEGGLIK